MAHTTAVFLESFKADENEILSMEVEDLELQLHRMNMPLDKKLGEKLELGCFQWCARIKVEYKPASGSRFPRHDTVRIVCGAHLWRTIKMVPLLEPGQCSVSIRPSSGPPQSSFFSLGASAKTVRRTKSDLFADYLKAQQGFPGVSGRPLASVPSYTEDTMSIPAVLTPSASTVAPSLVGGEPGRIHVAANTGTRSQAARAPPPPDWDGSLWDSGFTF